MPYESLFTSNYAASFFTAVSSFLQSIIGIRWDINHFEWGWLTPLVVMGSILFPLADQIFDLVYHHFYPDSAPVVEPKYKMVFAGQIYWLSAKDYKELLAAGWKDVSQPVQNSTLVLTDPKTQTQIADAALTRYE